MKAAAVRFTGRGKAQRGTVDRAAEKREARDEIVATAVCPDCPGTQSLMCCQQSRAYTLDSVFTFLDARGQWHTR